MFQKKFTELRVGIFLSVGIVLVLFIIFSVGTEHRIFQREFTLFANFEGISGLRIGAPVQLAGFNIGFVDKIGLPEDIERKEITVVMKIKREFQDRIRDDSVATIETQGLLGDKFVYISMGSESQGIIPDKGIIPTKETVSIFSLAEKAGSIMEDIGKAAGSVNEMLTSVKGKKEEGDLKAIISSFRRSVDQIEKGKGLLHSMLYDQNGDRIIEDLGETLKNVREIAVGAEKGPKANTTGLVVNLRHASDDLRNILNAINKGEGTLGKLVNDPTLYDDLRTFMGRANRNTLLRAVVRSTLNENDKQMLK